MSNQLEAFDSLPQELRTVLNYCSIRIDPRFVLGMYKQQGLRDTLDYLDGIGECFMSEQANDN